MWSTTNGLLRMTIPISEWTSPVIDLAESLTHKSCSEKATRVFLKKDMPGLQGEKI
jgi:hypothetical protein